MQNCTSDTFRQNEHHFLNFKVDRSRLKGTIGKNTLS
jgi:hypothetical protein